MTYTNTVHYCPTCDMSVSVKGVRLPAQPMRDSSLETMRRL